MTSRTQARAKPRKRMPAADRRVVILDAALGVFADAGFNDASLDAVAEKAGISKALIYEHFASKRDLHRALLDVYGQEMVGKVIDAAASADPGEDRLRAGTEAFLEFVEQRPEAWRMVFRHLDDPGVAEWVERIRSQVAETIAVLTISDAPPNLRKDGPGLELAAQMLAQQLIGAVQSLANWWDGHPEVSRQQMLELVMDFAWVGLQRVSDGERWKVPGS